jgi:exo-beta-1,3-glucanase (GH17 family)
LLVSDDGKSSFELTAILADDLKGSLGFFLRPQATQADENHSAIRQLLAKDDVAEILIGSEEKSLMFDGS